MAIHSKIDWNELVPLLPKGLREQLYLEAVMLLSKSDGNDKNKKRNGDTSRALGLRVWADTPHKGRLAAEGRTYVVVKKTTALKGGVGKVWEKLKDKSTFTFKDVQGVSKDAPYVVGYLWARRMIELAK